MTAAARATMDFFAAQAAARRRTAVLVFWFAVAWLGTIALVYLGLGVVLEVTSPGAAQGVAFTPGFLAATAAGVSLVTAGGSAWHASRLARDGGHAVAAMVGGVRVSRDTADPAEKRLVHVVEEMAIASGLPVPAVYVLPAEAGINAFAAGFTPERGIVALTRGAVDQLDRDELQGVVAHEFSHLLNADAKLNLRLVALVGGITVLALMGRTLLRLDDAGRPPGWRRSRGGGRIRFAVVMTGLSLWVAGSIGAFFGRVIRAAVSRQREFLADAAAVQFTRNPDGLAGALRKIALQGSAIGSAAAPEVSHFFFANALGSGWLATHPPIEERIRRIAPHGLARPARPAAVPAPAAAPAPAAPGVAPPAGGAALALAADAGRPEARHVAYAADLLSRLPAGITSAARDPRAARALACALLADPDPAVRAAQLAKVADPAARAEIGELAAALAGAPRSDRMAVLGLLLPALDGLSPDDAAALVRDAAALAAADGRTTVYEWAVLRILRRRLARHLGAAASPARARALDEVQVEAHAVLSVLAWLGTADPDAAQAAMDAGARVLGAAGTWRPLPRERVRAPLLESALERLDGAVPALKQRLVAACAATALADGKVVDAEGEVVRAVAASLGVPVPPLGAAAPARAAGTA